MPESLKSFIKDTSWSLASLVIAAAVQFILRIFLARYYGAADLGLYTLAFSVYSFGLVFSGFGINVGLVKYVAEHKEDTRNINILMTNGSAISVFSGCIMGLLLYLSAPYISNYFFRLPELTPLLRFISISFPFIALEKSVLGFLNGLRRMRLFALINIMQNILVIVLTFLAISRGLGISYAVLALVLPLIFISLISLAFVRKSISGFKIAGSSVVVKMLLAFGFYVVLANGMGTILTYTDSLLLGHFMTEIDVGYYTVAIILVQMVALPPSAVQSISGPMIASYWGKNQKENIGILINRCMKYAAFYAILVALVIGFLSRDLIVILFDNNFITAALPLQILLVGAAFNAIQASIGSALSSTAYVKIIFKLTGITVLLNIILNIILIPHFGITGAALATSSSIAASAILQLYFTQRLIGIKIYWLWFARLFGFSIIIAAAAYGVGKFVNPYVCTVLAILILFLGILKFFVDREDRKQIMQIIHFSARG